MERLTALVRVSVFYFAELILLVLVGGILQFALGVPGVALTQLLIFFGLPILFTRAVDQKPLKPFLRLRMLNGMGFLRALFLGVVCLITVQVMSIMIALLLKQFGGEMVVPYDFVFDAPAWVAILGVAVVPALCEELSFRGYVQRVLAPFGPTAAVLLTGILFGALHMSLIRLLPLSLLGVLWALAVQRSGSILPGMIMHLLNNGIALGLTFFVQGTGNPAGDLSALDQFPPNVIWLAIAMLAFMSIAFTVAAYFLAASFSPKDLLNPADAAEDLPGPAVGPEEPEQPVSDSVSVSPEAAPDEVQALKRELANLKTARRRLMLQATGIATGLLTLGGYVFAVVQEWKMVFK